MNNYCDGWRVKLITRPGIKERLVPPSSIDDLVAAPGTLCSSVQSGLPTRAAAIEFLRIMVDHELGSLDYSESKNAANTESPAEFRKRHRTYLEAVKLLVELEPEFKTR